MGDFKVILFGMLVFLGLFTSVSTKGYAQKFHDTHLNEFSGQLDNDFFLLDLRDRYYTNGVCIEFKRLVKEDLKLFNPLKFKGYQKTFLGVEFNHKIYNPVNIKDEKPELIDRPYAGLMYVNVNWNQFWKNNSLQIGVDLGWIGPGNHTDDIQTNAHKMIGWVRPRGWEDYQINNSPIIQINSTYEKEVYTSKYTSVAFKGMGQFGSIESYILGGGVIRLGKVNQVAESIYSSSRLSFTPQVRKEIFFFYAPEVKKVFYNATIEGNLWGDPSSFIKESKSIVYYHKAGLMYGYKAMDFKFYLTFLSEEVVGGEEHAYGTLVFSLRI